MADTLILAGGQARRLDGIDKAFAMLNEKPLIQHCIERINRNANLVISANRNHHQYTEYADNIVSDNIGEYEGPLAGIYSALKFIKSDHLLVLPCDMPFLPLNLYDRLAEKIGNNTACAVKHADQVEPLLLLVKKTCIHSIANYIREGHRSVIGWLQKNHCAYAEYNDISNQFFNINTRQDLKVAEAIINKGILDSTNDNNTGKAYRIRSTCS